MKIEIQKYNKDVHEEAVSCLLIPRAYCIEGLLAGKVSLKDALIESIEVSKKAYVALDRISDTVVGVGGLCVLSKEQGRPWLMPSNRLISNANTSWFRQLKEMVDEWALQCRYLYNLVWEHNYGSMRLLEFLGFTYSGKPVMNIDQFKYFCFYRGL